jgi:hypothetical protein
MAFYVLKCVRRQGKQKEEETEVFLCIHSHVCYCSKYGYIIVELLSVSKYIYKETLYIQFTRYLALTRKVSEELYFYGG